MPTALYEFLHPPRQNRVCQATALPSEIRQIEFARFTLQGPRLGIGDAWCPPEAVTLLLPAGHCHVIAECYAYNEDRRIAAVSVVPEHRVYEKGGEIGRFDADTGSVGIVDYDRIDSLPEAVYNKAWEYFCQVHVQQQAMGEYRSEPAGSTMVYCPCGFGDGDYPVYVLLENGRVIGAEARFISPDEINPLLAEYERLRKLFPEP